MKGFDEYFGEMPWAAIPFDSPLRKGLGSKFGVSGIPSLIVLNTSDGSIVTSEGRAAVMKKRALAGAF